RARGRWPVLARWRMNPELASLLEELREVAKRVYQEVSDAAASVWCWTGCTAHVERAAALVATPDQIAQAYALALERGDPDAEAQAVLVVELAVEQAQRLAGWASDQSLGRLLDLLRRLPAAMRQVAGEVASGAGLGVGAVAAVGLLVMLLTRGR